MLVCMDNGKESPGQSFDEVADEVFGTVDEQFGKRLQHYRKALGLSQEQLAARVAEHGGAIHQTTIMRTERGERHATLNEFLLFAAALNVPPPLLLIPLGDERLVAITPKSKIHPHLALKWFVGYEFLAASDRRAVGNLNEFLINSRPLRLYNRLQEVQEKAHGAWSRVKRLEYVLEEGDELQRGELSNARADLVDAFEDLAAVLFQMRKEEIQTPEMPEVWTDEMRKLGIGEDN